MMKNVIHHIKKEWVDYLDGTYFGETVGGSDSSTRDLRQAEEENKNGVTNPEQFEKIGIIRDGNLGMNNKSVV